MNITGTLLQYNVIDSDGDMFLPGSIKFLGSHLKYKMRPIATFRSMREDETGLYFTSVPLTHPWVKARNWIKRVKK